MISRLLTIAALASCLLLSADTLASQRNQFLPDPKLTPGVTNPDITQDNIGETICHRSGHWSTKLIRPSSSYTNKIKRQKIGEYGYADKRMKSYELDHLVPLTLGGAPRDPRNLWPEIWVGEFGAHVKDRLEEKLNKLVCDGTLTLKEAQTAISKNWIAAYRKFVGGAGAEDNY